MCDQGGLDKDVNMVSCTVHVTVLASNYFTASAKQPNICILHAGLSANIQTPYCVVKPTKANTEYLSISCASTVFLDSIDAYMFRLALPSIGPPPKFGGMPGMAAPFPMPGTISSGNTPKSTYWLKTSW